MSYFRTRLEALRVYAREEGDLAIAFEKAYGVATTEHEYEAKLVELSDDLERILDR